MTTIGSGVSLVCLALASAVLGDPAELPLLGFRQPTVKGVVVRFEPASHCLLHEDSLYVFRVRHYGGDGTHAPAFLALRKADRAWVEITHLSTEHARLGRSPDFHDIPLSVGWDFGSSADSLYVALPLHTSGSIVFPDRVSSDPSRAIYRLDFHSALERDSCLTTFWVLRADLDGIEGGGEP